MAQRNDYANRSRGGGRGLDDDQSGGRDRWGEGRNDDYEYGARRQDYGERNYRSDRNYESGYGRGEDDYGRGQDDYGRGQDDYQRGYSQRGYGGRGYGSRFDREGDLGSTRYGNADRYERGNYGGQRFQDENRYGQGRESYGSGQYNDDHYHDLRERHMREFDRDYGEYRRDRQERMGQDFDEWRRGRTSSGENRNTSASGSSATEKAGNKSGSGKSTNT